MQDTPLFKFIRPFKALDLSMPTSNKLHFAIILLTDIIDISSSTCQKADFDENEDVM